MKNPALDINLDDLNYKEVKLQVNKKTYDRLCELVPDGDIHNVIRRALGLYDISIEKEKEGKAVAFVEINGNDVIVDKIVRVSPTPTTP